MQLCLENDYVMCTVRFNSLKMPAHQYQNAQKHYEYVKIDFVFYLF